ncbi:C40 family peptidase [[Clostridium] dakarense]|uniref:C40 family peptidase n=1 Tax=Faecalimicrobium dakarense TaxID=1301100 RepID=UPI0004B3A235|nr:C40 family peptidase [[Clostridium] dakarense]
MSDVSQIVLSSLLNSMSRSNLNNRNSLSTTNSDPFDYILKNTLGNSGGMNGSCTCSCSCSNNSLNTLEMLSTILSTINMSKIDTQKTDIHSQNSNTINTTTVNNDSIVNESKVSNINESKTSNKMDNAIKSLEKQIGKPYVWGANGPNAFDCSGLVRYIYKTELGKDIPRVSYDQSKFGQAVEKKDLQPGDLVFFDTMKKGKVSHVGMYIGNDEFIHASNPRDGVKKSKLSGYYEKVYRGARRP